MPRFSRDPATHRSPDRSRVLHVTEAVSRPTGPFTRGAAESSGHSAQGRPASARQDAGANAEIGRTLASARRTATERALDLSDGHQGRAAAISNWQTVSNRSTGSTTAGTIVFAARKRHAKHESSQLLGEECWLRPADVIAGVGGVGTVIVGTHQPGTTARRGSNAPQPNAPNSNGRAAHGSPSWPANSRQATKQRESALSQPSSTLEPAVK